MSYNNVPPVSPQTPIVATDSDTVDITANGSFNHTVKNDPKLAPTQAGTPNALRVHPTYGLVIPRMMTTFKAPVKYGGPVGYSRIGNIGSLYSGSAKDHLHPIVRLPASAITLANFNAVNCTLLSLTVVAQATSEETLHYTAIITATASANAGIIPNLKTSLFAPAKAGFKLGLFGASVYSVDGFALTPVPGIEESQATGLAVNEVFFYPKRPSLSFEWHVNLGYVLL